MQVRIVEQEGGSRGRWLPDDLPPSGSRSSSSSGSRANERSPPSRARRGSPGANSRGATVATSSDPLRIQSGSPSAAASVSAPAVGASAAWPVRCLSGSVWPRSRLSRPGQWQYVTSIASPASPSAPPAARARMPSAAAALASAPSPRSIRASRSDRAPASRPSKRTLGKASASAAKSAVLRSSSARGWTPTTRTALTQRVDAEALRRVAAAGGDARVAQGGHQPAGAQVPAQQAVVAAAEAPGFEGRGVAAADQRVADAFAS